MTYPTINFIGSKKNIANEIVNKIKTYNPHVILDAFAGSGSISYEAKKQHLNIISNDVLYSNYIVLNCFVRNSDFKFSYESLEQDYNNLNITEKDIPPEFKVKALQYYFEKEILELFSLITIFHNKNEIEKDFLGTLIRRAMIRKMPYSRFNVAKNQIVKLRDEEYSYQKYGRRRAYHNKSFLYHIEKETPKYNDHIIKSESDCKTYNLDIFDIIEQETYDFIYLDPPYPNTMNKYSTYYGPIDELLGKSLLLKNDFENKLEFYKNMSKLLLYINTKNIRAGISCNTNSKEIITNILNDLNIKIIEIFYIEHSYKLTNSKNKNKNKEIFIII